jgi:hopene-associated glycosyltransferase HpnB
MLREFAGAITLLIWLYLVLGRGGFWRTKTGGAEPLRVQAPEDAPSIVAVIPARNEAQVVGKAVASLARQTYPGRFHIVLVDDDSEDGTAEIAREAASSDLLSVVRSAPLPPGWTGKLWAVSQGVEEALRHNPEYLLLTDADILHSPDGLSTLLAEALEDGGYDLVSWMVTLHCESLAERALIPAFVFFFFLLYPPSWIRSARYRTAGAAGGCMLIRRSALERIGGIASIRGELIDDCELARAIKRETASAQGRVRLGLHHEARSIREYRTLGEVFRMISRSAYTQLHNSPVLLAGTILGLAITFFIPPVSAISGSGFGLATWLLLSMAYSPMLRFYGRSVLWAPLLPVVAAFYMGATVHSAWSWYRGTAGMWKGRAQAKLS